MSRSQALAMDNANAKITRDDAVLDEIGEPLLRFGNRHAMQIDFRLHAVAAAGEFAHRSPSDRRPLKTQCSAVAVFDRINIVVQALFQRVTLVGAGETRSGFRLGSRFGNAVLDLERRRIGKCPAKFVYVFVVVGHSVVIKAMVSAKH